jgi:hypothetical protein
MTDCHMKVSFMQALVWSKCIRMLRMRHLHSRNCDPGSTALNIKVLLTTFRLNAVRVTLRRTMLIKITFKNPVRTSKETQRVSMTTINWFMLFKEITLFILRITRNA